MNQALQYEDDFSELEKIQAQLAEKSLYEFVRYSWPILHPKSAFTEGWHIEAICEHLEAMATGEIKNLIINIGPRYSKSTVSSVCFPAWVWIREPSFRWVYSGYSIPLATEHSVWCRRIIESEWYRRHWGNIYRLTSDQNAKAHFENSAQGARSAFGLGGITGRGGDFNICDDPHSREDWSNADLLKKACNRYDTNIYPAVNEPNESRRLVVMQRISALDLSGHLYRMGGWDLLMLPTEYDPKRSKVTSIGWKDPRTKVGELLCPARLNAKQVATEKKKPRQFQAQHQQNPSADQGAIFKRNLWQYYSNDPKEIVQHMDIVLQSWDMSFKDNKETSSMVAGQVWGMKGANRFLLDRILDHLDFTKSVDAIKAFRKSWPAARIIVVEDKANGTAIINHIKSEISGVIPWPPEGEKMNSKIARAWAQQPEHEAKNLWLPSPKMCPWVEEYVEYMAAFPDGEFDDDVDATTQALAKLARTPLPAGPQSVGQGTSWLK